jgi:ferredoxin
MAFVDEVRARRGGTVELLPEDRVGRPDLAGLLRQRPAGGVVYCCGPEGLIRAVVEQCALQGISDALHVERFAASATPPSSAAADPASFEVYLAKSDVTVTVPPERSLLEAVRDVVPDHPSSCEEGICGTCETAVLEGVPDHHDEVLTESERAAGKIMMICVGRSKTPRLVLDL